MANKAELVVAALQQRIGEIVSTYETQIAILRAEITQLVEKDQEKNSAPDSNSSSNAAIRIGGKDRQWSLLGKRR